MFVSVLGQTAERKKERRRKIVGFRSRQTLVIGDLKIYIYFDNTVPVRN